MNVIVQMFAVWKCYYFGLNSLHPQLLCCDQRALHIIIFNKVRVMIFCCHWPPPPPFSAPQCQTDTSISTLRSIIQMRTRPQPKPGLNNTLSVLNNTQTTQMVCVEETCSKYQRQLTQISLLIISCVQRCPPSRQILHNCRRCPQRSLNWPSCHAWKQNQAHLKSLHKSSLFQGARSMAAITP